MKKLKIIMLFCLLFTECLAKQEVDSLYIRYFSWENYMQPHIITCNNFEDELPYTEYCVSDRSEIDRLLGSMKELPKTSDTDFCVGCKLLFLHKGMVVKKACLNSKYVMTGGQSYLCTQELMNTINDIMHKGVIMNRQDRFLPNKYGDEYIHGRETLFSELEAYYAKHVPESIRKNGDTRIVVYCKSNKKGKTTKIESVRIYNTNLSDSQTKDIEQLIYRFFMRKVRWKPDETRMESDWITIYYKIEGDQGIIP